jgi:hypothetical protein
MSSVVRQRDFITLLGGVAVWPVMARAQEGERVRRIGALMSTAADDAEGRARIAAFLGGLEKLGWIDGHDVRIDFRWGANDADRNPNVRRYLTARRFFRRRRPSCRCWPCRRPARSGSRRS